MNPTKKEYSFRINKVLDFIEKNYDSELTLDNLASIANFSKYHFHRIFVSIVNETLFGFIQRIRLDKAAAKLLRNLETPVSDIAYSCGFSSQSVFARAFKEDFGMNDTEWRNGGYGKYFDEKEQNPNFSNLSKTKGNLCNKVSKFGQNVEFTSSYFRSVNDSSIIEWSYKMFNKQDAKITVKEMPAFDVAYIRHIGPYQGNPDLFKKLFEQICGWAGPRGLIIPGQTKFMCIYYDDPEITDKDKLRLDVCLSIPPGTEVNPPFGKTTMPAGKYAIGYFELGPSDYGDAWKFIYGEWLPQSGFQPDDRPCYENYLNSPDDSPDCLAKVEIIIPVIPL